jgi:hypothetical protein
MFAFGTTGYWIFTVVCLILTVKSVVDYNQLMTEKKEFIVLNKWTSWMITPLGRIFIVALNVAMSFVPYYNAYVAIVTPVCYVARFLVLKNLDKKFNLPMAH